MDREVLPKVEHGKMQIVLAGESESGKTYLFAKLWHYHLKDIFGNRVILFCPGYNAQMKRPHVYHDIPWRLCFDFFDEKTVEDVFNSIPEDNEKPVLFVFDDCIAESGFKKNGGDHILNKIAHRGRHRGISTCYLTQRYNKLAADIREELNYLFLIRPNKMSIDLVRDEFGPADAGKSRIFPSVIEAATKERYTYVYLNRRLGKWYNSKLQELSEIN